MMLKQNAPYSGARRSANMQVADGRSTPGDAGRGIKSSSDLGNTMITNTRNLTRSGREANNLNTESSPPAKSPSQPQEAYSPMSSEDAKLVAKMNARRAAAAAAQK